MRSGYNIRWTSNASEELANTIQYLEDNFSSKEIKKLAKNIEEVIQLLALNPTLFTKSESENIYRVVILKFNTMYYRLQNNEVEILSFFSNRQNPNKTKL